MQAFVEIGLANALLATVLALFAAAAGRVFRFPALTHFLWLLVLAKLLTPPLARVPVPWPETRPASASAALQAEEDQVLPSDNLPALVESSEPLWGSDELYREEPEPPTSRYSVASASVFAGDREEQKTTAFEGI